MTFFLVCEYFDEKRKIKYFSEHPKTVHLDIQANNIEEINQYLEEYFKDGFSYKVISIAQDLDVLELSKAGLKSCNSPYSF